jgi:hypothetical protein
LESHALGCAASIQEIDQIEAGNGDLGIERMRGEKKAAFAGAAGIY